MWAVHVSMNGKLVFLPIEINFGSLWYLKADSINLSASSRTKSLVDLASMFLALIKALKGQLISKGNFGDLKSTKKPMKYF